MPVHVRGRGWRCVYYFNTYFGAGAEVQTKFPKMIGIDQFYIIMYSRGLHLGQINSVMLK